MPLFQLVMKATQESCPETLQFCAADLASAVEQANHYTSPLPAELWSDGRRLCGLQYDECSSSWFVSGDQLEGEGIAAS